MSNIAAGNKSQVETLFEESVTIHKLVDMASQDGCRHTKIKAIHFVSNVCTNKWVTSEQLDIIVAFGGIKALLVACEDQEPKVASAVLDALSALLEVDVDGVKPYQAVFVEAGGLRCSERLKTTVSSRPSTSCFLC